MTGQFPSRMFRWAAVYGVLVLAPLYALPLPARQPEITLGFIGVALVFQWVFWIVGSNPARYRALMLPAVLEKLVFGVRSEERRVGKECVTQCRSRWSPYH